MAAGHEDPTRERGERSVDWEQWRALLGASIKLDLRSSRAQHGRMRRIPPMVGAFVTYLIMGTLLSAALVTAGDAFVFSLFTLSAAMFMTALLVVMEYSSVVVHPDDFEILAHRPVSSKTYFWSKIANLAVYVSATTVSLGLPAAVFGAIRFRPGFFFGLVYFAVALLACQATAALVVLIYTAALKIFNYDRFTRAITYVHALATLLIVLGYVLLPRFLAEGGQVLTVTRGPWAFAAPPAWFAGAVELLTGSGGDQSVILTLLAAASSVALVAAALNMISLDYARKVSELATESAEAATSAHRRRWSFAELGSVLLRSDEERVGFELMRRYMTRDRKLRARIYPAFGLPLAVYIYGLISGGFYDPFAGRPSGGGLPVQQLLGFYSVFITLFFATAITQSDQWQASWFFYTAPVKQREGIVTGARKLIIWRYILPFFGVLFVLLAFVMPPLRAGLFVLIVLLLALIAFALISLTAPHLPLSQSIEKSRQAKQIGLVMLLGIAVATLTALMELLREIPGVGVFVVVVLAGGVLLAEIGLRVKLRSRLAGEEFPG